MSDLEENITQNLNCHKIESQIEVHLQEENLIKSSLKKNKNNLIKSN
jgi:hypothetical protein